MLIQNSRDKFENFLSKYLTPNTLIDLDTKTEIINNRWILQYIMYTVNHKYTFNLFDDDVGDDAYCYITMKPRMPLAGSESLPVFEIWEGYLTKENMIDMFMTILSNETVNIAHRNSDTELVFVNGKLEWK